MDNLCFRLWLEDKESKHNKVQSLVNGQNLILFFTKNSALFGAPEESRLVFAKMKSPDEDMPDGWEDEANFIAFDLMRALAGERIENMFGKKDLNDIKIIDPEKAATMLMKVHDKSKSTNLKNARQSKHGVGMLQLKDKK